MRLHLLNRFSDALIGFRPQSFLDTQVSLAPTHVSWLVSWLVGQLVTLSDFQSVVSNGRSNQKKFKKQSLTFFEQDEVSSGCRTRFNKTGLN